MHESAAPKMRYDTYSMPADVVGGGWKRVGTGMTDREAEDSPQKKRQHSQPSNQSFIKLCYSKVAHS